MSVGARALVPISLAFAGAPLAGCADVIHQDVLNEAALASTLSDGPRGPLDVALALGCPADEESGSASECERCRVTSALSAWRAGEVRAVIFTGGAAHNRHVEADAMADLAVAGGMPSDAALREGRALTTWMNLRYSQAMMRERGFHTALIISTAAHLPRARRFADWYGIPARYRACDRD